MKTKTCIYCDYFKVTLAIENEAKAYVKRFYEKRQKLILRTILDAPRISPNLHPCNNLHYTCMRALRRYNWVNWQKKITAKKIKVTEALALASRSASKLQEFYNSGGQRTDPLALQLTANVEFFSARARLFGAHIERLKQARKRLCP